MLITAPFAGPVSFPLLVAKVYGKLDFTLKDISETNKPGDVILDSITNLPGYSVDYKIVAGVYVKMYSLVGNKSSKKDIHNKERYSG